MGDYGLIIVDDEEMMRDGLSSYVKWEDIGFRLDGVFEDGTDAMEWLGEHDTHVILTDLRMTHASGLDVASFVRDKKLDIKIVIISGYSDFEAAQKALGFHIRDYLLKPISVKKIRETLGTLKDELDKERNDRDAISREIEDFESLKSYVEERFISQLVLGGLRRPAELERQVDLIDWDRSVLTKPCALFYLSVVQRSNSDSIGDHDSIDRGDLIGGMISRFISPPRFYWHRTSQRELGGIFVECGDYEGLEERVRMKLENVIGQAKALSVNLVINRIQTYRDLNSLARSTESITPAEGRDKPDIETEWEERQRLIISHVLENQEVLARELLDSFMDFLSEKSWDNLINGLVELFSSINRTFNRANRGAGRTSFISFADFFSLTDRDAVYDWTRKAIRDVTKQVQDEALHNQVSLINRAKEYVEANFTGDVMLSHVAEHVNLSPVYLSRLFKEQAGANFSDYLIECRINRACQLLRDTGHKIYEICEEVGYSDVKHFYGLFKKKIGCTPSEYRHGR
jgi:two-component system, response regulator YesN